MPKLVKNGSVQDDAWEVVVSDEAPSSGKQQLLPLAQFLELAESDKLNYLDTGCWLKSDDDIELLAPYIKRLCVIGIHFETFMDGRSFSQARTIREHLDYEGELRAIGAYIQDQMFYLSRCGIDAFVVAEDADFESIHESLNDFNESYQAAYDEAQPYFAAAYNNKNKLVSLKAPT